MDSITLIIGTLLTQLAIGTFITGYIFDKRLKKVDAKCAFITTSAAFAIGVVGLASMILHLGHPLLAFNSLFNVGRSWLSREVITYGAFLALVFVYLLIQKGILKMASSLSVLGLVASIMGFIAAVVTSLIYTIPSIPAWNSMNTPVSFVLTACLMGFPLGFFLSGAWKSYGSLGAKLIAAVAILALIITLIYVSTLAAGIPASAGTAYIMLGSAMFWVRIALLAVAGIFAGYVGWKGDSANVSNVFGVLFCMLAVSEALGRILFYTTIVRL